MIRILGRYSLLVVHELVPDLEELIANFRKNTPGVSNTIAKEVEARIYREKHCSDDDIKRWILVFDGETLIGTTAIYCRVISMNWEPISLGGIGEVRVAADNRREGIATEMIAAAMRELIVLACDMAFLSTDINSFLARLYERYGFVALDKPYSFYDKSGKLHTDTNGMIVPIWSPETFRKVIKDTQALHIGVGNW